MADEKTEATTDIPDTDDSTINRRNNGEPCEEWEVPIWAAYVKGERNISFLAKRAGVKWETCNNRLILLSKIAAGTADGIAPDGEYIAGLELDLRDLERLYRQAIDLNQLNAAIGAKKLIVDCREKIAVAKGMTTERGEVGVKGDLVFVQFGPDDGGGGNRPNGLRTSGDGDNDTDNSDNDAPDLNADPG